MAAGIFLQPKDIQILEGYSSYDAAWSALKNIRFLLNKKENGRVTMREYAQHRQITVEEVKEALSLGNKK